MTRVSPTGLHWGSSMQGQVSLSGSTLGEPLCKARVSPTGLHWVGGILCRGQGEPLWIQAGDAALGFLQGDASGKLSLCCRGCLQQLMPRALMTVLQGAGKGL